MRGSTMLALAWIGYTSLGVAQTSVLVAGDSAPRFADAVIGDRKLRYLCVGEGSPTVIVEPGLGGLPLETVFTEGPRSGWAEIVPQIASETRICVYDRAGVGMSDRGSVPRTSLDVVVDLHGMLHAADIQPPYVFAGHSFGGLNARLFANRYPAAVVGMILIDSTHPDSWNRWSAALPAPTEGERPELAGFRTPPGPDAVPERIDIAASLQSVRNATSLGEIPLIVMTVRSDFDDRNVPNELEAILRPIAFGLQRELLDLSSSAELVIAQTAGHNIHFDEPQLVIEAILDVVSKVRLRN